MNDEEVKIFIIMMTDIAYEMHDMEGISPELKEKLLELWRQFNWLSNR